MAVLVQMNISAGVKVRIDKPRFTIGREEDNDLCIDDELASRHHAVIERVNSSSGEESDSAWLLRDLQSTNGTHIKDHAIKLHALSDGDVLRIGKTFLKFHADDHGDMAETRIIKKTFIPGLFLIGDKE